jgi:hypothetical protein
MLPFSSLIGAKMQTKALLSEQNVSQILFAAKVLARRQG